MSYKARLPWLTGQLRTQIKEKKCYAYPGLAKSSDQLLNLKYKRIRNELTSTLRNTEQKYFSDELELNKSDLHKKWGVLRTILGKANNNSKQKIKLHVKGVNLSC